MSQNERMALPIVSGWFPVTNRVLDMLGSISTEPRSGRVGIAWLQRCERVQKPVGTDAAAG